VPGLCALSCLPPGPTHSFWGCWVDSCALLRETVLLPMNARRHASLISHVPLPPWTFPFQPIGSLAMRLFSSSSLSNFPDRRFFFFYDSSSCPCSWFLVFLDVRGLHKDESMDWFLPCNALPSCDQFEFYDLKPAVFFFFQPCSCWHFNLLFFPLYFFRKDASKSVTLPFFPRLPLTDDYSHLCSPLLRYSFFVPGNGGIVLSSRLVALPHSFSFLKSRREDACSFFPDSCYPRPFFFLSFLRFSGFFFPFMALGTSDHGAWRRLVAFFFVENPFLSQVFSLFLGTYDVSSIIGPDSNDLVEKRAVNWTTLSSLVKIF